MKKLISTIAALAMAVGAFSSVSVCAETEEDFDITVSDGDVYTLQEALNNAQYEGTPEKPYTVHVTQSVDITKPLHIYSNTRLVADEGVTFLRMLGRDVDTYMLRIGAPASFSDGYHYENVSIEGGIWDGNGQKGDTHFVMFKIAHAKNLNLSGCTFQNDVNAHMVEVGAVNGMTISKCTFKNHIANSSNCENQEALQLDVNLDNTTKMGNFDKYQNKNITVKNCTFDKLARGVGSHNSIEGIYFTNIVIKNNTFKNLESYAIDAINYRNSKIQNNKITNCNAGIYFINVKSDHQNSIIMPEWELKLNTKKDNSVISGNTIVKRKTKSFNYRCLLVRGEVFKKQVGNLYMKGDHRVYGVTIKNNTIKSPDTSAVQFTGAKSCVFSGNKIYFTGKKSSKNYIGLFVEEGSDSCKFTSNKIEKFSVGMGFRNNKSLSISKNTVNTSVSQGMYFDKTTATVSGCKINKAEKNHGIALVGKSKLTISKCTIKNCKQWGIAVVSGSATVKSCKFSGNKKGNIYRAKK